MDKTVHEPDDWTRAFQNPPSGRLPDRQNLQEFRCPGQGHLDRIDAFLRNDPLSDQGTPTPFPDEFQVGRIVLVARGLAGFDRFSYPAIFIHKIPFLLCEFFFRHGIGIVKIKDPSNRSIAVLHLSSFAFQNGAVRPPCNRRRRLKGQCPADTRLFRLPGRPGRRTSGEGFLC